MALYTITAIHICISVGVFHFAWPYTTLCDFFQPFKWIWFFSFGFFIQRWTQSRLQRLRYLRLCRATLIAQRLYKKRYQRRTEASVIMQSYVRMWLAKKMVRDQQRAALTIQVSKVFKKAVSWVVKYNSPGGYQLAACGLKLT